MSKLPVNTEMSASLAFTRQAPVFDALFGPDLIVQYKRERVRRHVQAFLPPASRILELNAGTGEDALFFARKGHLVHATDVSAGMLKMTEGKAKTAGLENNISTKVCSFTNLNDLSFKGPF